jgi:pyruvate/2-oxoglutarate dehydrogenase complex dihydrolipoamide dehydrogenase (E3) component
MGLPFGDRNLSASHVLVAAGDAPNSDGLGLDALGIAVDERGHLIVNDRLQTNTRGMYALGTVHGGKVAGGDEVAVILAALLDEKSPPAKAPCYTVATDPELGRVGMTEREARASGRQLHVAKLPFAAVPRAAEAGDTRGFMKVLIDARSREVLGAAVLGARGADIAAMLDIAMLGKLPYTRLRDALFAHATFAGSLSTLFETLETQPEST